LVDDTHIIGNALDVIPFFVTTWRIYNIQTFNATNKVCSLVSTWVRPIYITSSKFSYTWIWSSYSRCSNEFFAICWVFRIKGIPKGQYDSQPFYGCRSSSQFCNVFVLLCPTIGLPITYCISITKYLVALH
jgi:hypothetical protein